MAGIIGGWMAAGSIGLVTHPLRHALTWIALASLLIAAWPARVRKPSARGVLALAALAAVGMTAPASLVINVFAVAILAAVLARLASGLDRKLLGRTALAVAVLGTYRLALIAIPSVWHLAQWNGRWLGDLAGWIAGRPLSIGATYAGLDFLVVMAVLYAGWLRDTAGPRWPRALVGAVAILVGQMVYLVVLARATDLAAALPVPPPVPPPDIYEPPPWHWGDAVRTLLPWNLPLVAAAIHLAIAAWMFRCAPCGAENEPSSIEEAPSNRLSPRFETLVTWGPVALGVVLPLVVVFGPARSDLSGRTIVAYDDGHVNWEKPAQDRFGQASAGRYGMLPVFVESLGGRFVRSQELRVDDLAGADLLLVIHPTGPWPEDRLQRIWDFVRGGGTALVVAEPWLQEAGLPDRLNELLAPLRIEIRFDTAIAAAGHWEQSMETIAHPAAIGLGDEQNRLGVGEGASLRARWPARPILVGRFGWSDPGADAVLTGSGRYDPGEHLGDVVLAGEQPLGRGRIAVLADPSSLTNQGLPGSYEFTGRLLGHLAGRGATPQDAWRQIAGLLGSLALVGLLVWRPDPSRLAIAATVLALSVAVCTAASGWLSPVLPDGRNASPNNVALIDGSHLGAQSGYLWHDDGLAGLRLNLMRNGYLPLVVRRLDAKQLAQAALLVSIAPARAFSPDERKLVRSFVERGGACIATVGADRAGPIRPLLTDFGLDLPAPYLSPDKPIREPAPIGRYPPLKDDDSYYPLRFRDREDREAEMVFYARWPIECSADQTEIQDYEGRPPAAIVSAGSGRFVLLGDTGFAMNKNLESLSGEPMAGMRENSGFWRWLLGRTAGRPDLLPKKAEPGNPAAKPEPLPEIKPRSTSKRHVPPAPLRQEAPR